MLRLSFVLSFILVFVAVQPAVAEKGRLIAGVGQQAELVKKTQKNEVNKRIRLGYMSQDIPAVLSDSDVMLYKRMFRLQRQLQRSQVAALVPKLQNRELMGHLIAERLLHPRTKAPYRDLKKWLSRYGDHSMSADIYKLAKKRQPRRDKYGPKKPKSVVASVAKYSDPDEPKVSDIKDNKRRQALLRKLKYYRQKEMYSKSVAALSKTFNKNLLGEDAWAEVTLKLARTIFNDGNYKRSERLARMVMNYTDFRQSEALWLAGFSSYKQGKLENAASLFRRLAYSVPHNSRYFARAAFWTSKAYDEAGRGSMGRVFLNLAAQDSTSFYGQVAAEKLGKERFWLWNEPSIRDQDKQFLFNDPLVRRVIALSQIGEYSLAQQELKLIHSRVPYDMDDSLLALASQLKLPHIQMTLARNLKERETIYHAGLYPTADAWKPRGGYKVERALLHAVMRQESAFNPDVKSRAGARGLMQVMPATAKYIRRKFNRPVYSRHALFDPEINMSLGQDYLEYLMEQMNGNVIQVIASYNAGPGNVGKWVEKDLGQGDPLVFIESIPFKETRRYVQHVLSNWWIYKDRYREENKGLGVLAQNSWPLYEGYNVLSSR